MKLSELKVSGEGIVTAINSDETTKNRLQSMGLTNGVKVKVIRLAPLGDPIEIELRGFYLAIRKKTAEKIIIKEEKK